MSTDLRPACPFCPHAKHVGLCCECRCTHDGREFIHRPAPKIEENFKPAPDKCMRVMDVHTVCKGLGTAIGFGAIEYGVELYPVPGRIVWKLLPALCNAPWFEFCPYCGERIAYP